MRQASSKEPLIGRKSEKKILTQVLQSSRAEFVAVYGRRRVGKTFLVRSVLNRAGVSFFQLTGSHRGTLREQLQNFSDAWQRAFSETVPAPSSWHDAFRFLKSALPKILQRNSSPVVLFFDELPWLCQKNHRFLSALDHFWNDWAETQPRLKIVVCGSAASWMVKKIIRAKGGLHNRLTRRIQLQSFSVDEVDTFLQHFRIQYTPYDIVKLYLVLGGIPYYLWQLERGLSVDQNIQALSFDQNGALYTEFDDLYDSLFSSGEAYKAIVSVLSRYHRGLTRTQLIDQLPEGSGGGLTQKLENLETSGFIRRIPSLNTPVKNSRIRLIDEFSQFALRFLKPRPRRHFQLVAKSASFRTWAGLAFETFCLRHVPMLREALGIAGIVMHTAQYWQPGTNQREGLQIDLLFDRDDNIIDLCEMKFSVSPFAINKKYANELRRRTQNFSESTKTRKSVHNVFVTIFGIEKNRYAQELVDKEVNFAELLTKSRQR